MTFANVNDPDAVRRAVQEFDELVRDAFLQKYGFGRARDYFLLVEGKRYDSKAIFGAAHGYQFPDLGPLHWKQFSGGALTVERLLERMGFVVVGPRRALDEDLTIAREEVERSGGFDPHDIEDARKRTFAAIVMRQGQSLFRRELLRAYQGRCAITACDVTEVLEAAHIIPYQGTQTNHMSNGLLLRADLHTLFDLGLLAIAPSSSTVVIAPSLRMTHYGSLHGQSLWLPASTKDRPSGEALSVHYLKTGLAP
ncbi:hypothetical protein WS62_22735 [Burkholderia sp. ABCPW 14]|uniref:HNH endonuclease n=1 Tax=Burkholderia sp. ABCPW 14 TaxID=1637860 RepID=UPI000770CBAE|nr:HNH endonuclease [Burkholderia sp. ABCPW 14]KVD82466.1 hypothetical protein WS62_22735 [Burkholderia sp. ABCPW 14]